MISVKDVVDYKNINKIEERTIRTQIHVYIKVQLSHERAVCDGVLTFCVSMPTGGALLRSFSRRTAAASGVGLAPACLEHRHNRNQSYIDRQRPGERMLSVQLAHHNNLYIKIMLILTKKE